MRKVMNYFHCIADFAAASVTKKEKSLFYEVFTLILASKQHLKQG
jgi:hypothetical protein